MNQSLNKKKPLLYKIGISLVVFSFVLWFTPLIVPFLPVTASTKAVLVTGALILAEVTFWIGVAIVGKEVAMKFRSYFNPRNWKKRKE